MGKSMEVVLHSSAPSKNLTISLHTETKGWFWEIIAVHASQYYFAQPWKTKVLPKDASTQNDFIFFFGTYIGLELFQYMSGNLLIPLAKAWGGTLFWTECTSTVLVNKRLDCTKNAVIVKTIGWRPKRHMVDVAGLCKVCLDSPLMEKKPLKNGNMYPFCVCVKYCIHIPWKAFSTV